MIRQVAAGRQTRKITQVLGTKNDTGPADDRPAIWVAGRQAPAFHLQTFAEASMLLARDAAAQGLHALSGFLAGLAGPRPQYRGTALLAWAGRCAAAARRLLYGLNPRADAAPGTAKFGAWQAEPVPQKPTHLVSTLAPHPDPEIAAIRALLLAEPDASKPRRNHRLPEIAPPPAPSHTSESHNLHPSEVLMAGVNWAFVRLLVGAALAFATPLGLIQAVFRHFSGTDLRATVEDCRQIHVE